MRVRGPSGSTVGAGTVGTMFSSKSGTCGSGIRSKSTTNKISETLVQMIIYSQSGNTVGRSYTGAAG